MASLEMNKTKVAHQSKGSDNGYGLICSGATRVKIQNLKLITKIDSR